MFSNCKVWTSLLSSENTEPYWSADWTFQFGMLKACTGLLTALSESSKPELVCWLHLQKLVAWTMTVTMTMFSESSKPDQCVYCDHGHVFRRLKAWTNLLTVTMAMFSEGSKPEPVHWLWPWSCFQKAQSLNQCADCVCDHVFRKLKAWTNVLTVTIAMFSESSKPQPMCWLQPWPCFQIARSLNQCADCDHCHVFRKLKAWTTVCPCLSGCTTSTRMKAVRTWLWCYVPSIAWTLPSVDSPTNTSIETYWGQMSE